MTFSDLLTRPARLIHVLLLALLMWGGEYALRHLWEPDEARYAYVAQEMRQGGNWAVPHRHGELYAHKPPLMFWLINLAAPMTGGINEVSARLPSLLGVVLALWATARLARRWFGAGADWRAILILSTAFLFRQVGGMGQIDALLCGLEMLALYAFFSTGWTASSVAAPLVAYAAMGLAVLAKGPVGFVVPTGVFIACALAGGERRQLKRWHWLWGPLVTLAFPAAWLAWAWHSGAPPEYFQELIGRHVIERAAGETGHVRGPLYYLEHFPAEFMPWTLFLPSAWLALREAGDERRRRRALLAWMAFVIVFFSLSPGKRQIYILAAYPAAALLIAGAWPALARLPERWQKGPAWLAMALTTILAIASVGAWVFPLPIPGLVLLPGGLVLLAAAVVLWTLFPVERLSARWFGCFSGGLFAYMALLGALVLPAVNPLKTPVALAEAAQARLGPDDNLLIYKVNGEILALYAKRAGKRLVSLKDLRRAMRAPGHGMVVFEREHWEEVKDRLPDAGPPHEFRMGNKNLVWLEFGKTP